MRHVNGIFLKKQNKYKNTGQTHIIFYYSLLANYGFCLQLFKSRRARVYCAISYWGQITSVILYVAYALYHCTFSVKTVVKIQLQSKIPKEKYFTEHF